MKRIILLIILSVSTSFYTKAATTFVHPGGTTTLTDLERIKTKVLAKEHPWIDAWNLMIQDYKASSSYTAGPQPDVAYQDGTRQRCARDAQAAYYNILEWYVTGDESHAKCAVNILNAWASAINDTVKGQLFQLPIDIMVQTAEVVRIYSGWSDNDKEKFKQCCLKYFYPACKNFLGYCGSWPGWDGPANSCNEIIGIFCDNDSIYQNAIDYYKNGDKTTGLGGGRLTNMVFDKSGASIEMGRDMPHAEIGPSAAAEFCLTALNQGTDLFSLDDNLLLRSFEFLMKDNLTHQCDWTSYNDCDNHNLFDVSPRYAFRLTGFPGCEIIYNHYVNKMGLQAPYTEQAIKLRGLTNYGWEASNYPVLTYIDDGAQTVYDNLNIPSAPINVQAVPGINCINLSWTRPDWRLVNGSIIQRSTNENSSFETIGSWTMETDTTYVDSTCTAGLKYYYRIALKNNSGQSEWSPTISATAVDGSATYPSGWYLTDLGSYSEAGKANYDKGNNRNVIVRSCSKSFGGTSDNCTFFYTKQTGSNFTFIARIYDYRRYDNRADHFGIMIREGLGTGARMIALGLHDVEARYTYLMPRTKANTSVDNIGGDTHTWNGVWYKLVRKGYTFTAYQCYDGKNWHQIGSQTIDGFSSINYLGVYSSRGWDDAPEGSSSTGFFDNITITNNTTGTKCTQPTSFCSISVKSNNLKLTWNSTSDAISYKILRSTSKSGQYLDIADAITDTTFIDRNLSANTDYYYILSASNFSGESVADTLKVTTTDHTTPDTPTNVKTVSNNGGVYIEWDRNDEATQFNLLRSDSESGSYETVKNIDKADVITANDSRIGVTDATVVTGNTYYYKITAQNTYGTSNASALSTVTVNSQSKLTGTIIGTDGTSSFPLKNAFDNSLYTYYVTTNADEGWAGYDLGENKQAIVTQIRYGARASHTTAMVGGFFQGSNESDFNNASVLYSITNEPTAATWSKEIIYSTTPFRYLRYVSPKGSYGNIAEIQFIGTIITSIPESIASETISNDCNISSISYYNINGTLLKQPINGINIMKTIMKNGKINIKKIITK
jgi:fibronectin type 3 domain-containing protein|nr:alginate lyase family protein [Prevotella sp.]